MLNNSQTDIITLEPPECQATTSARPTSSKRLLNIVVHDYAGHPFQAQLSRALAARGHSVTHLYSNSNPTSPKGSLELLASDPVWLKFDSISLPQDIAKTSFLARQRLEALYGRLLAARIEALKPDVVICANTPLDALVGLNKLCKRRNIPWVFWLQDLVGKASATILRAKLSFVGGWIGDYYSWIESRLMRSSNAVIGIAEDFRDASHRAGVPSARYRTIPNWAPLDEIIPRKRNNGWAEGHGLLDRFVFLYSGTLGFKHRLDLFISMARAFQEDPDTVIVVNSEGPAADWLRNEAALLNLTNLKVNPFQPYAIMSDVLGTADVLISILEPVAGAFSVPSKVLSYHCAARAMLLAIPDGNLAARIVQQERTGLVVDPGDLNAFVEAAKRLKASPTERAEMGARARAYAERTFDIDGIARQFEAVLANAV